MYISEHAEECFFFKSLLNIFFKKKLFELLSRGGKTAAFRPVNPRHMPIWASDAPGLNMCVYIGPHEECSLDFFSPSFFFKKKDYFSSLIFTKVRFNSKTR